MKKASRVLRFIAAWVLTFLILVVAFLSLIPADESGKVTLGGIHSIILLIFPVVIGLFYSPKRGSKQNAVPRRAFHQDHIITMPRSAVSSSMYQEPQCPQTEAVITQYDFTTAAGIRAIPGSREQLRFAGRDDTAVDRCLRQKSAEYEKAGKTDLAILCLKKSNEIRFSSRRGYRIEDYYSLVGLLARCGRIEEAQAEKNRIDHYFGDNEIDSAADYADAVVKNIQDYAKSLDTDLVIMNPHGVSCPQCAKYQGRVFSLSGRDRRFPKIPAEFYTYGGIHKGCVHGFSPYIHGLTDPMLDYTLSFQTGVKPRYRRNIIAFSNRPFIDDRLPEDIAKAKEHAEQLAAERAQRQHYREHIIEIEAQRGIDQRDYKWLQENLPDICPKSYSGYMRMKNSNTPNFQKLAAKAIELGHDLA